MTSVATLRASERAECAYALFIEGIPYVWVTEHTGDALLGSGTGTWIARYENDNATFEDVGQRTVVPGLKIDEMDYEKGRLDFKDGLLETTQASFTIVDFDGLLPDLFASERGNDYNLLGVRIPPGSSALSTSVASEGSTTNPRGRYIDIERIGPAGERAWMYPFPFRGTGYDHQVHPSQQSNATGPAPVVISDDPIRWEGRKVALYRIYHDYASTSAQAYLQWPTWDDQYDAGNLEWFGVMRDYAERIDGNTWKIHCHGPESLARRRLGRNDHGRWMRITNVVNTLAANETGIAIAMLNHTKDSGTTSVAESLWFGTETLSTTGDKSSYTTEIQTIVDDLFTGAYTPDFGSGAFNTFTFDGEPPDLTFFGDSVHIRRHYDPTAGTLDGVALCVLCMHEKVWRILGWDPALQAPLEGDNHAWYDNESPNNPFFVKRDAGERFYTASGSPYDEEMHTPGDGYWTAHFSTTSALDHFGASDYDEVDSNGGATRVYQAINQGTPLIFPGPIDLANGPATFTVSESFPYIEGARIIEPTLEYGRYFAFKGKRIVGSVDDWGNVFDENGILADALDAIDEVQIAQVEWNDEGSYGTVSESTGAPTFSLVRWIDPRTFGVERPILNGEWVGLSSSANDDFAIECIPLHSYACREAVSNPNTPPERCWQTLMQLLLSTGTAAGFSSGTFTDGTNTTSPTGDLSWMTDVTTSQLGLGIPHQLVQSPSDMLAAFDLVSGGAHGGFCQTRYSFSRPFESKELIRQIVQTRGLALTLRGGVFAVEKFGEFSPEDADFTITEQDLYGALDDPTDVEPEQQTQASGAVDEIRISYAWNPGLDKYEREDLRTNARDPGSRYRRGDQIMELEDGGLRPAHWGATSNAFGQHFYNTWAVEMPTLLARRHSIVTLRLSRIQGQDLWPGARTLLTNQHVWLPDGTTGITNAVSHVLAVRPDPENHAYEVDFLVYADGMNARLFSPIGKIAAGYTGGTGITLVADASFLEHGEGEDGGRFVEPSWSDTGGNLEVCILEYDRVSWTLHSGDRQTVTAGSGTSVTLNSSFSTTFHANSDKYLVAVNYGNQTANEWPRALLLPVVLDNREFGSGPTVGWPFSKG